ncbi:MAG: HAMP domain-containing histidine kinase [Calothrix sp. SM1_7_51]|nr:HAMP domain-containing histidine kinase [Calothrix sp. SM1_7_51]
MRAGSERIQQIVNALQNFSQSDNSQKRFVDLHEGIDSVVRILQYRLKEKPHKPRIKVTKQFTELPLLECYGGELNLAFMNIINNSIDALEEKIKVDSSFIPEISISSEIVSSHLTLVRNNESSINSQPLDKRQKSSFALLIMVRECYRISNGVFLNHSLLPNREKKLRD